MFVGHGMISVPVRGPRPDSDTADRLPKGAHSLAALAAESWAKIRFLAWS